MISVQLLKVSALGHQSTALSTSHNGSINGRAENKWNQILRPNFPIYLSSFDGHTLNQLGQQAPLTRTY